MATDRRLPSSFRLGVVAACALVAGLGGAWLAWYAPSDRQILLVALGVVIPIPVLIRVLRRRFDLFEPITILTVSLATTFFMRPLGHIGFDFMKLRTMDITAGFDRALLICLVATIALYAGYELRLGRTLGRALRPLPDDWHNDTAVVCALGLVAVGFALFAVFVLQSGGLGIVMESLQGRGTGDQEVADSSSAYFYNGLYLCIPAAILLLYTGLEQRSPLLLGSAALLLLFLVAFSAPSGGRLWLMVTIIPAVAIPYLRTGRRPGWRLCLIGVALVFFVGITFLRNVRTAELRSRPPQEELLRTFTNPGAAWEEFILGGDTEMFAVIAAMAQTVPSEVPHHHGITLGSLLTHWVPRQVWPAKPESADTTLFGYLFPEVRAVTKAGTAPTMFGGFYFDAGYPGLIIGSVVVGVLFRTLYEYFRANRWNQGVQILFAAMLPFVIVLFRGNPTDTMARVAFVIPPLIVGLWLSGRSPTATVATRSMSRAARANL